jgi:hypothetical protein
MNRWNMQKKDSQESYQQRIRDEWVSKAAPLISQFSSYSSVAASVYDLLISGELEVPQKGENSVHSGK